MVQYESEHLAPRRRFVAEAADWFWKDPFLRSWCPKQVLRENLVWDNGVADEGAASSSSPWYAKVFRLLTSWDVVSHVRCLPSPRALCSNGRMTG